MSPTLFIIYTIDMPIHFKSNLAKFANDTLFYSKNKNMARYQLQRQVNMAMEWFHEWKFKVNAEKTLAVLFGRTKPYRIQSLRVNNTPVTWSSKVKYLGVTIGRWLDFGDHVKSIIKKATRTKECSARY